jgi:indole-3-glycerol phosphate synthase
MRTGLDEMSDVNSLMIPGVTVDAKLLESSVYTMMAIDEVMKFGNDAGLIGRRRMRESGSVDTRWS